MSGIMMFKLLPCLTLGLESFWVISILTCLQGQSSTLAHHSLQFQSLQFIFSRKHNFVGQGREI